MSFQDPIFLVIAGAALLLVGLLLGSLLGGRGNKSAKPGKEVEEIKKEGYSDIARLWYSPATKKLIAEMDEAVYREFAGLDADRQKKIVRLSELFTSWVNTAPAVEEKPAEAPEVKVEEKVEENPVDLLRDETLIQETIPARPARPGSTKPLPFVESEPIRSIPQPAAAPVQPAREEPVAPFQVRESQPAELIPEEPKSKSISGQINDVIDDLIKTSPLRDKGVRLVDRDDHGIDVIFGGEKFSGIDAVPYPDVKALIKAAVTRWERETAARNKMHE